MKPRTPISIYIIVTIGLVIMAFEMFSQDGNYFTSPYFWVLLLITTILLLIMNSIGDLVENENYRRLSEEERQRYLQEKKYAILAETLELSLQKAISNRREGYPYRSWL
jgi:hypothetical protein